MNRPLATLVLLSPLAALACGEVVSVPTHDNTTMRYALVVPQGAQAALVLLPGGAGHLDLGGGAASCHGGGRGGQRHHRRLQLRAVSPAQHHGGRSRHQAVRVSVAHHLGPVIQQL